MAYVTVTIAGTKRDVEVAESAIRAAVHRSPDVRVVMDAKHERKGRGIRTALLFEVNGSHKRRAARVEQS